jgi:hypothetical protein
MVAASLDAVRPVWKMRWIDLWWLAGYPVYQTIGTARHKASHALVAMIEGADVHNVVVWPTSDWGGLRFCSNSW